MTQPVDRDALAELGDALAGLSLDDRRRVAAAWAEAHRAPPARLVVPPVGIHRGVALYNRARRSHWVQCTCGWSSRGHAGQAAALAQHAEHVEAASPPPAAEAGRSVGDGKAGIP